MFKLKHALVLAPVLLFIGILIALSISSFFLLLLLGYFLMTTMYSLALKRRAMVDVVVLASLYTVRMVAGAIATTIPVSLWLFSFSMFFFFSLACAKRFSELCLTDEVEQRVPGRGYFYGDRDLVGVLGVSSAMTSILVLALYVTAQEVVKIYSFPDILLLLCPLFLLWISRVWLSAYRGELDDDPIVFALRFRGSYLIGAVALTILFLATTS
jgi:4-hydroxybenzoate polyprenyltransferase